MHPEQHRDGEHGKPHRHHEIGRADILAKLFAEAEPGLLGLHERHETEEERQQPADISEAPAEARHESDALPRCEIG